MQTGTRRLQGIVAALLMLVGLTGCSAEAQAAPETHSAPAVACSTARAEQLACGLYVAVRATQGGHDSGWLPTMPIRLWFETMNRVRTAIIDTPVNTTNQPTSSHGSLLWTGKNAAETAVGCLGNCEADAFTNALTEAPAHYRIARNGAITIAAAHRTALFEPTAAPLHPRSCDIDSIDPLPCTRLVSVSGTSRGVRVDALRTRPLTVALTGRRGHHTAIVHSPDGTTWTLVLHETGATISSSRSAPDRTTKSGSTATSRFLAHLFAARVTWKPHSSAVLLTAGDRTLQLEGAD